MSPIRGIRWKCTNCLNYNLCSECESQKFHAITHIFAKIEIPAPFIGPASLPPQPILYPGDMHRPNLISAAKKAWTKNLTEVFLFQPGEIDSLITQFFTISTAENISPDRVEGGIGRLAFSRAFMPYNYFKSPRPNLCFDRLFAFYDQDGDGVISLLEFIEGQAILQRKVGGEKMKHYPRLRYVFDGYDVDADGYVSRKDFLRMFRSYYALERETAAEVVKLENDEMIAEGNKMIMRSNRPLGAAFGTGDFAEEVDHWQPHEAPTKHCDGNGDLRPEGNVVAADYINYLDRPDVVGFSMEYNEGHVCDLSGEECFDLSVHETWARRRFYTDEEEGAVVPHNYDEARWQDVEGQAYDAEDQKIDQKNILPTKRSVTPDTRTVFPRSRSSSSKVRFTDDADDTRSNTSSSSRRSGERWGGYELPCPEEDVGKDILYQLSQNGFNELLDPLFKPAEDLAVEVHMTGKERDRWRKEIAEFTKLKEAREADPLWATANAVSMNNSKTTNEKRPSTPPPHPMFPEISPEDIPSQSLEQLLQAAGYGVEATRGDDGNAPNNNEHVQVHQPPLGYRHRSPKSRESEDIGNADPTLPQNRPTSENGSTGDGEYKIPPFHIDPCLVILPNERRLARLSFLNSASRDIRNRGGGGRINWEEFEAFMKTEAGRDMAFVESMIQVGSY